MTVDPGSAPALARLDRIVVAALLLVVAGLAWAFTVHQSILMDEMEAAMWRDMDMSMNGMEPSWTPIDALLMFVMWSAMMAAMMVPRCEPDGRRLRNHRNRRRRERQRRTCRRRFLADLIVWTGSP